MVMTTFKHLFDSIDSHKQWLSITITENKSQMSATLEDLLTMELNTFSSVDEGLVDIVKFENEIDSIIIMGPFDFIQQVPIEEEVLKQIEGDIEKSVQFQITTSDGKFSYNIILENVYHDDKEGEDE